MRKPRQKRPLLTDNLSIRQIYVGEIDTTIELDIGGPASANDFYNSYYIRNQDELEEFLSGKKFFVYGQKGAGKTAFLRFAGETLRRRRDMTASYNLYRFAQDFPDQAHRDITEFVRKKRSAAGVGEEEINIFRDIDYEDFWTFIILERVQKFLQHDGKSMVLDDHALASFRSLITSIDKGTVQDRILRLVPRLQKGKAELSINPKLEVDFEFNKDHDDLEKFSKYVNELKKRFFEITWSSGFINFMFDEIDPRVGSGKLFELDCILIRDLIITIYKLNTGGRGGERRAVFSAAIRSELLQSVERLGKEVQKYLSQLGIHMNWGEYGKLDETHPLVRMLCKKIVYSEKRAGLYVHAAENEDDDARVWRKYFRRSLTEELSVTELFRITWLKPRDTVRLLNICKTIEGNAKYFSSSLFDRSKTMYANESWQEIQAQLVTSLSPDAISALDLVLTRFFDEFTLWDLQHRIDELSLVSTKVSELKEKHKVGDLIEVMYLNGILGNKDGRIHRFYFRGDNHPQITSGFVVHPGLRKRFAAVRRAARSEGTPMLDLEEGGGLL